MAALNGDPGLQPQRTALAWSRTALAAWANALLVMRAGLVAKNPGDQVPMLMLGGLMVLAALTLTAAARWRQLALDGQQPAAAHPAAMLLAGGAAAMASAVGAVFVASQAFSE